MINGVLLLQLELEKLSCTMSVERSKNRYRKWLFMVRLTDFSYSCRHIRTLETQNEEDELAVANLLAEKQFFLKGALKNYILCLRTGVTSVSLHN